MLCDLETRQLTIPPLFPFLSFHYSQSDNRVIRSSSTDWLPAFILNLIFAAHLDDIADHQVADLYLRRLSAADDAEGLLALDAVLEAAELLLLGPVVEGRHQHDDDHRDEDGSALDPRGVLVLLNCSSDQVLDYG